MSALSELQDILRRRFEQRTTPGFAGGTLEDQIARDSALQDQQTRRPLTGDIHPSQSQTPFPTTQIPVPPEATAPSGANRQRTVSFDPTTGEPHREYYDRMPSPDRELGYEAAISKWSPGGRSGYKRGALNTLKAMGRGALIGAGGAPQNPLLGAIGGGLYGGAASLVKPSTAGSLSRAIKMRRAGAETDRALQQARIGSQIEMNEMEPVTLDDNSVVMVPKRQAGALKSQQQRIAQQREVLEGRVANWASMSADRRKKSIVAQYKAGMLNDPKSLEYAAHELGIPGELMPAFIAGEMYDRLDDEGNIVQISRRTGTANPVTQDGQPVKSYETTKEAGRQRRATEAEAGRNARTAANIRSQEARAAAGLAERRNARAAKGSTAVNEGTKRHAAKIAGEIKRIVERMKQLSHAIATDPNDVKSKELFQKAAATGAGAAAELDSLHAGWKAGVGDGWPYAEEIGQPQAQGGSDQRLEGVMNRYRARTKREPSAAEVEYMKQLLNK